MTGLSFNYKMQIINIIHTVLLGKRKIEQKGTLNLVQTLNQGLIALKMNAKGRFCLVFLSVLVTLYTENTGMTNLVGKISNTCEKQ